MRRPTIYLAPLVAPRGAADVYGRGRRYSIAAAATEEERDHGQVWAFTPAVADVVAVRAGKLPIEEHRAQLLERWRDVRRCGLAAPGKLVATLWHRAPPVAVAGGDTLTCRCRLGATDCHRYLLAPILVHAGWAVILDGQPVTGLEGGT